MIMTSQTHMTQSANLDGPPQNLVGWLVGGSLIAVSMFGGIAAWAMTTRIDGAVIAQGTIVVESNRKSVQRFEGGVVAEILVRDGTYVEQGDPLIRLDVTQVQSELAAVLDRLEGLRLRRARLEAELRGDRDLSFPEASFSRLNEPKIAGIAQNERGLFTSRRAAQSANADLLRRRIGSLQARLSGQAQQKMASEQEYALLDEQLANLQTLLDRKLIQAARILEIRRDMSQLRSAISTNEAEVDSLGAQIREVEAELRQAAAALQSQAAEELSTTQADIHALEEQAVVLKDRMARTMIVAPQSGKVLNLVVNIRGAVIAPGAAIMEIVPVDDRLILSARVPAVDIERVHAGQTTRIRLTAFNQNSTPEMTGIVDSISADVLLDEESGLAFYTARVFLDNDLPGQTAGAKLVPGMPAEVLIATGERLASSYLLRPLEDAFSRTFRDE